MVQLSECNCKAPADGVYLRLLRPPSALVRIGFAPVGVVAAAVCLTSGMGLILPNTGLHNLGLST